MSELVLDLDKELIEKIKQQRLRNPLESVYGEVLWAKREAERKNGKRSKAFLHASDFPYCMRACAISHLDMITDAQRKEMKKKFLKTLRLFDNGTFFHERMQTAFKQAGIIRDAEKKVVSDEFRIGGSMDGIIDVGYGDEILELKSINSFVKAKKDLPFEEHKMQATTYMFCEEIYRTRFYYEDKNTQSPVEIVYELDDAMLTKTLQRSQLIWKYIERVLEADDAKGKAKALPPAKCILPSQPEAKNCLVSSACFGLMSNGGAL